jgi:TetR/AcrR family fatty acid metabolism transcriptional regulator
LPRNRENTKHERILQAAVRVFAKKGFYNAKVSEIAREAKVADGTVYLYFKSKDDILIHIFEEEMEKIIRTMRSKLSEVEDPMEKLRVFVNTHLGLVESNPDMAELIQVELRQSNKFMKHYENRKFHEYLDILADIVAQGQREGAIRSGISPSVAKRVIFGALDEMSTYWVFSKGRRGPLREICSQVFEILSRGLMAGGQRDAAEEMAIG